MKYQKYPYLCFKQRSHVFTPFIFAVLLLFVGCDNTTSTEEPERQIKDALILLNGSGDEATIEAGETVKFTGYALTESGDQIPLDELGGNWSWGWQSTDPAVFTVDTKGNATGVEEGEAYCVITLNGPDDALGNTASAKQGSMSEAAGKAGLPEMSLIFVGRDSAFVNVSVGF